MRRRNVSAAEGKATALQALAGEIPRSEWRRLSTSEQVFIAAALFIAIPERFFSDTTGPAWRFKVGLNHALTDVFLGPNPNQTRSLVRLAIDAFARHGLSGIAPGAARAKRYEFIPPADFVDEVREHLDMEVLYRLVQQINQDAASRASVPKTVRYR